MPQMNEDQNDRPLPDKRKFNSTVINTIIDQISFTIQDPVLRRIFQNTFPNTLDTTVSFTPSSESNPFPDTFVITGDINAMWLRDSMNQVHPYIQFAKEEPNLQEMLLGVIYRQVKNVLIDNYANAFNEEDNGMKFFPQDISFKVVNGVQMEGYSGWTPERKFETDSLCSLLRLSTSYYNQTGDYSFLSNNQSQYIEAVQRILLTFEEQMRGTDEEDQMGFPAYTFERNSYEALDSLIHTRGQPALRCGLVKQGFRPSDDACLLPFNIPANAFISKELKNVHEMLSTVQLFPEIAERCLQMSKSIEAAINQFGIQSNPHRHHEDEDAFFAYEVDGYGNKHFSDDANVPNLLSLPYFGFIDKTDPLYQVTRKMVLSKVNPWFFEGTQASGLGSQHTDRQFFWPIGVIMQALTSDDDAEIQECIRILVTTTNDKYFMHESVNVNDQQQFTRSWFAWANTLFGELIVSIYQNKPYLLKEIYAVPTHQKQSNQKQQVLVP